MQSGTQLGHRFMLVNSVSNRLVYKRKQEKRNVAKVKKKKHEGEKARGEWEGEKKIEKTSKLKKIILRKNRFLEKSRTLLQQRKFFVVHANF